MGEFKVQIFNGLSHDNVINDMERKLQFRKTFNHLDTFSNRNHQVSNFSIAV